MKKHQITFVAEFDGAAVPGLNINMKILGGRVISTFIGNAVEQLDEQRELTEKLERTNCIYEMYELARSFKNQSMHAIVEGLYDAGYRKE
ncbi:hypothetical protein NT695_000131 [Vibrio fluvialis]|nr:hypothetical protein [Vibrio fluvialis]